MAIVNDIYAFLNEIAPVRYQMDFDNAGFLVGDGGTAVKKALLALDITDDVIAEAAELRAQLIVSHHPLIFTPLRHATTDDLAGRKVLALAQHGISAICMHTNLDIADGGVNDALMAALGAEVTGGLEPAGTAVDGSALTCGRIGKLPKPMTMAEFLPYVAGHLHANGLRYVDGGLPVERLAVCGGSGGNMLELAAAKGCDTFVTADVKYDRFLAAKELGINLIDADHFCTETWSSRSCRRSFSGSSRTSRLPSVRCIVRPHRHIVHNVCRRYTAGGIFSSQTSYSFGKTDEERTTEWTILQFTQTLPPVPAGIFTSALSARCAPENRPSSNDSWKRSYCRIFLMITCGSVPATSCRKAAPAGRS